MKRSGSLSTTAMWMGFLGAGLDVFTALMAVMGVSAGKHISGSPRNEAFGTKVP
jgi:hypothetical protein